MGQYGPHSLDLDKKGDITLRDGVLYFTLDGRPFGRLLVGPDGVTFDGVEVTAAQEGDPAAFNLMTRGNRGCGKISVKEIRGDGRGEEVGFIHGGLAEDAKPGTGDYRGQFTINVRPHPAKEPERVFIATSSGSPGRIWTGLRNFAGWLRGFSYAGDEGAYTTGSGGDSGRVSRLWTDNKRYCWNIQGDSDADSPFGAMVVYDTWVDGVPVFDEGRWTAVAVVNPTVIPPKSEGAQE